MPLNRACLRKQYPATTTVVTRKAIEAYARACNETNPRYFNSGIVGPPMFAVVVTWIPLIAAMTDPDLHADLLRLLHTAQDMQFRTPIHPGDTIIGDARIMAIEASSGGESLTLKLNATNQHGELVNQTLFTALIRGRRDSARAERHQVEAAAPPATPVAQVTETIDRDQTVRYAEASGDRNPIHVDDAVAKMAGLPGIIVHGLCTMAFAARAVVDRVCDTEPSRLRRLAVRFSRPVFPGESITTSIWPSDRSNDFRVYRFLTTNPDRLAVIRDGVAEVSVENQ